MMVIIPQSYLASPATSGLDGALDSARSGFSTSTASLAEAAQQVAGVIVELSDEALAGGVGAVTSGDPLLDGLMDAKVAEYMALANASVFRAVDETMGATMELLGGDSETSDDGV